MMILEWQYFEGTANFWSIVLTGPQSTPTTIPHNPLSTFKLNHWQHTTLEHTSPPPQTHTSLCLPYLPDSNFVSEWLSFIELICFQKKKK
jgi:hypothetical protein